jgi:hypothetical protein
MPPPPLPLCRWPPSVLLLSKPVGQSQKLPSTWRVSPNSMWSFLPVPPRRRPVVHSRSIPFLGDGVNFADHSGTYSSSRPFLIHTCISVRLGLIVSCTPTSVSGQSTTELLDATVASTGGRLFHVFLFPYSTCGRYRRSHRNRPLYLLARSLHHQIRYVHDFLVPFSTHL